MLLSAAAMLMLTGVSVDSSYGTDVLPGLLVIGLGLGLIFAPAMDTATRGVEGADAGVASALVNTGQQVGGSIGTALLSTLAASAAGAYASTTPGGRRRRRAGRRPRLHHGLHVGRRGVRRRRAAGVAAAAVRRAGSDAPEPAPPAEPRRPPTTTKRPSVCNDLRPWRRPSNAHAATSSARFAARRSSSTAAAMLEEMPVADALAQRAQPAGRPRQVQRPALLRLARGRAARAAGRAPPASGSRTWRPNCPRPSAAGRGSSAAPSSWRRRSRGRWPSARSCATS